MVAIVLTISAGFTAACTAGHGVTGTNPGESSGIGDVTFAREGDTAQYCALLQSRASDLPDQLEPTDVASALVAIETIKDVSVIAPGETKANWASLRRHFEPVIDAATYPQHHCTSTGPLPAAHSTR